MKSPIILSVSASTVNLSKHFKKEGIPALLVYKNGQLIGNFIHVTDYLDEDFYSSDVETFLTDRGMLNYKKNRFVAISSNEVDVSDTE